MAVAARGCQRTYVYFTIDLYAPGECPADGQEPGRWATVTSAGTVRNWHTRAGAEDYVAVLGEEIAGLWEEIG